MLGLTKQLFRSYPNNLVRKPMVRHHGYSGGIPGCNLPFRIDDPYRLWVFFMVYCFSGCAIPWFAVWFQLRKSAT